MEAIGRRGEEAKEEIAAKQGYGTSSYVCVRVLTISCGSCRCPCVNFYVDLMVCLCLVSFRRWIREVFRSIWDRCW